MNWEDLLLIGGLLTAVAFFSGSHAHAAPVANYTVTAKAAVALN